jgi:pimeloyl-ACP methyl ester carboxylesterase
MSLSNSPTFSEHRVPRGNGTVYVRDYPGKGPAFVLLHGFPDNLHIYDDLIPALSAAGRRVVAFDFLGFGASDKPPDARYSFQQQLGDLEAVADALRLGQLSPVGHDAGGPAAVNFAIAHPERVSEIYLMNAFYGPAPTLRFPEFIEFFATKTLKDLTRHLIQSPEQFAWLLNFQRGQMQAGFSDQMKAHYNETVGPIVDNNFRQKPSAGPAFAQMTYQLFDEVAANKERLRKFEQLDITVRLIWGELDNYLNLGVAEDLRAYAKKATLDVLPAGHWPQIDLTAEVARIMVADGK